jgi:hypothetical protein
LKNGCDWRENREVYWIYIQIAKVLGAIWTTVAAGWEGYNMDVSKILTELRDERQQIEEAIVSLERLARGRGRRRGRPPAWMSEIAAPTVKRRGRPPGSKNKTVDTTSESASKGTAA